MTSPEYPPITEFDMLTAAIEIDYVTEKLGVAELIIRESTKLLISKTFNESKYEILNSPTDSCVSDMRARIIAEKNYPGLAKFLYED